MASRKPTQPPAGDMNALILRVNELSQSVLKKGFTSKLQDWKRWLNGEGQYDAVGLRDVVLTNAIMLDDVEDSIQTHIAADNIRHERINDRLAVLEAQPSGTPLFPFEG